MGTHHATQRDDRLGGLVGRGVLTAAAALALAGGGAGVAFAGDGPSERGPDASQGQDHGDDCSCDGHDDGPTWHDDGWQDQDDDGWQDEDDDGWQGQESHDPGRPDGHAAPAHHGGTTHGPARQTASHTPTTEKIPHGGRGTETVPITSGVMR
jgi:hypothetical protein